MYFWSEAVPNSLATATLQTVEYRIPKTAWMILEKIFAPSASRAFGIGDSAEVYAVERMRDFHPSSIILHPSSIILHRLQITVE